MIKTTINPIVNVEKIPMNTDTPLNIDCAHVIPATPATIFLIGKPGSGKSNLLLNLIFGTSTCKFYNKAFDVVYFCGNVKTINSKKEIDLPEEQIFDDLTIDMLESIEEQIANSDESVLLIIDDQAAKLKMKGIKEKLRRMVFNRRHLAASGKQGKKCHGLWLCITAQKFNTIEKAIRQLGTHYALFKPNTADSKDFFDEILACSKDTWISVMSFVYDQPHNFVWYNATNSSFHKNFNKIEFTDDVNEFDF
jgi:hypothetical protein